VGTATYMQRQQSGIALPTGTTGRAVWAELSVSKIFSRMSAVLSNVSITASFDSLPSSSADVFFLLTCLGAVVA
jgi:hypothetical protein